MSELFRLRSKGESQETQFIGSYITREAFSFLSLYCIYQKRSRATIVREMIENLRERNEVTEDEMIETIADEAKEEWFSGDYMSGDYNNYQEFIEHVEHLLFKRGIDEDRVVKIVNKINQLVYDRKKEEQ